MAESSIRGGARLSPRRCFGPSADDMHCRALTYARRPREQV
jgi:hypothetical protein